MYGDKIKYQTAFSIGKGNRYMIKMIKNLVETI